MQLKRYDKAGCSVVWSNSKTYSDVLASTSINPYNPNLSDIELLSIDFGSKSKELNVMGRAIYNSPFRCMAWGTFGEKDGKLLFMFRESSIWIDIWGYVKWIFYFMESS